MPKSPAPPVPRETLRAANVRTGALLTTIAIVFFVGIIASQYLGGVTAGLAVLGIAAVLYLVVAIGRNVGNRR